MTDRTREAIVAVGLFVLVLGCLLLGSVAAGQEIEVGTEDVTVAKVNGRHQVVEDVQQVRPLRITDTVDPVAVTVVKIPTLTEADIIEAVPLPSEAGQTVGIKSRPGKYLVTLYRWDESARRVVTKQCFLTIEGPDPPEPDPDPDDPDNPEPGPAPADEFDNVGQRVAVSAKGLPRRPDVATNYRQTADQLREDLSVTIGDVSSAMVGRRNTILGDDAGRWAPTLTLLQEDLTRRWPLSRYVLADYYDAIATGLEHAK